MSQLLILCLKKPFNSSTTLRGSLVILHSWELLSISWHDISHSFISLSSTVISFFSAIHAYMKIVVCILDQPVYKAPLFFTQRQRLFCLNGNWFTKNVFLMLHEFSIKQKCHTKHVIRFISLKLFTISFYLYFSNSKPKDDNNIPHVISQVRYGERRARTHTLIYLLEIEKLFPIDPRHREVVSHRPSA